MKRLFPRRRPRFVRLLAGCVFAAALAGCFSITVKSAAYEPGLREGTGRGFRGPVRVRVLVSALGIENIEILEHNEDEDIGGPAMDELLELILEYGSTDMVYPDAVSGATASGRGFLEAVENALLQTDQQSPDAPGRQDEGNGFPVP
jgi:uncharacterized protein with FMN-binding domain